MNKLLTYFILTLATAIGSTALAQDEGADVKKNIDRMIDNLTLQAASPEPLKNVEQRRVDVAFIDKLGEVKTRKIRLYLPLDAQQPYPLIYVPHYEMAEASADLRAYLAEGWAVASPTEFLPEYNGALTDDDLVFNNAALHALRHMPEFDPDRIGLDGGSAGGYMTLMLAALQPSVCAAFANAPIANVYFNFEKYFLAAEAVNNPKLPEAQAKQAKALAEAKPEDANRVAVRCMMETLPMPVIGLISGTFDPILNNFPDKTDYARWEAFSPCAIADAFSSPVIVTHCTSDVLVPVDQTTRRFTYAQEGETMPATVSSRLPQDFPGKLSLSLEEALPAELTVATLFDKKALGATADIEFDADKPFNLNIYDDGKTQGYGMHTSCPDAFALVKTPYFKTQFSRGLAQTEFLTRGKLRLLLDRYNGKSVQLPAHEGVDDSVYGSLAVYQAEVAEGLARYAKNHGLEELEEALAPILAEDEEAARAWTAIRATIARRPTRKHELTRRFISSARVTDSYMGLTILHYLETFREGAGQFLTPLFLFITTLGVADVGLALVGVIYWTVNKEFGYYLYFGWTWNLLLAGALKNTVCAYRPWVRDPTIVPNAVAKVGATGYSFPSGHSMNAASLFGGVGVSPQVAKAWRITAWGVAALVGFSRLYLSVHTPQDVLVGLTVGAAVMYASWKLLRKYGASKHFDAISAAVAIVSSLALAWYVAVKSYPTDYDADGNLLVDGAKTAIYAFRPIGMVLGCFLGRLVERKYVRYELAGALKTRVLTACVGLAGYAALALCVLPALEHALPKRFALILSGFAQMFYLVAAFPAAVKWSRKRA